MSSKGTLEILKALRKGDKRFGQLLDEGVPRVTLARRLKELEGQGYVERSIVAGRPPFTIYRITEEGRELYGKLLEREGWPLVEECAEIDAERVLEVAKRYLKIEG